MKGIWNTRIKVRDGIFSAVLSIVPANEIRILADAEQATIRSNLNVGGISSEILPILAGSFEDIALYLREYIAELATSDLIATEGSSDPQPEQSHDGQAERPASASSTFPGSTSE